MQLQPFKLERFFAKYEFKAPYLLCGSDCESLRVQDLLDLEPGADTKFQQLWLGYTESPGSPELREAITRLYQNINPGQVLVHTGAEEAIFNFMNVALKPGDHLIVHFPSYQSLMEVARARGCEVTPWVTREADGWELDINFLKQNIRSNTRAVVVNCPHNPTGYVASLEKFMEIIEIVREHKLLFFSDEVYRGLEHASIRQLPAAADVYEKAISLGVLSKTYGLAGLSTAAYKSAAGLR